MPWLAALGSAAGTGAAAGAAGGAAGAGLGAAGGAATAAGAGGMGSALSGIASNPGIQALMSNTSKPNSTMPQSNQVSAPKVTPVNAMAGGIPGSPQNPNAMQQAIMQWLQRQQGGM